MPDAVVKVNSIERLRAHLMLQHLREIASGGEYFYTCPRASGWAKCVTAVSEALASAGRDGELGWVEREKTNVDGDQPDLFFTLVKTNPDSWHTIDMSPAAGRKLRQGSMIASFHRAHFEEGSGPIVELDAELGNADIMAITSLNKLEEPGTSHT